MIREFYKQIYTYKSDNIYEMFWFLKDTDDHNSPIEIR